jgi:hypothetical protein
MAATIRYLFTLSYETHVSDVGLYDDNTWTTGAPQPWWGGGQPQHPPSGVWEPSIADLSPQVLMLDSSGGGVGVFCNCNLLMLQGQTTGEFRSLLNGRTGQWSGGPWSGEATALSTAKPTTS